jgi:hypothetical protein
VHHHQGARATAVERGLTVTIQLTTTSKRDLDALVYFLNASMWQKRVTLKSGRQVYGLPSRSSAGLFHLTDGSECTCKDWTTRQPEGGCAHMRAAVLYRMERQAEQTPSRAKKADNRLASILGPDEDKPWCPACSRHHTTNMHYISRMAS